VCPPQAHVGQHFNWFGGRVVSIVSRSACQTRVGNAIPRLGHHFPCSFANDFHICGSKFMGIIQRHRRLEVVEKFVVCFTNRQSRGSPNAEVMLSSGLFAKMCISWNECIWANQGNAGCKMFFDTMANPMEITPTMPRKYFTRDDRGIQDVRFRRYSDWMRGKITFRLNASISGRIFFLHCFFNRFVYDLFLEASNLECFFLSHHWGRVHTWDSFPTVQAQRLYVAWPNFFLQVSKDKFPKLHTVILEPHWSRFIHSAERELLQRAYQIPWGFSLSKNLFFATRHRCDQLLHSVRFNKHDLCGDRFWNNVRT